MGSEKCTKRKICCLIIVNIFLVYTGDGLLWDHLNDTP